MCALNYERLGHPERKLKCLLGVLLAAAIYIWFLAELAMTPGASSNSMSGFSLMNLLVSLTYYDRQKKMFAEHLRLGGRKASIGVPLALSLVWTVILAVVLTSLASLAEMAAAETAAQEPRVRDRGNKSLISSRSSSPSGTENAHCPESRSASTSDNC